MINILIRIDYILIGGSLKPGRTVGWFGGAGSLGGGGALILERGAEPEGKRGADLEGEVPDCRGVTCGLKVLCSCIMLFPCIPGCLPLTTARRKIGSVGNTNTEQKIITTNYVQYMRYLEEYSHINISFARSNFKI
jgi:hypothetical protein